MTESSTGHAGSEGQEPEAAAKPESVTPNATQVCHLQGSACEGCCEDADHTPCFMECCTG